MNIILTFANIIPPDNFPQFLLWALGGALGIALFMWRLYLSQIQKIEKMYLDQLEEQKKTSAERLDYTDNIIKELTERLDKEQLSKEKIISEIKPSLDASNSIATNVLEMLRNARK